MKQKIQIIQNKERIQSIDMLRGAVMLLMALDHVRDYFSNFFFEPTDLIHTTSSLFFTRWITHFCAPIFIFLIGTSMFIALSRGQTKKHIAFFLITRGLWLIIAECTLIHFVWAFNLDFSLQDFQVFGVAGISMIVLGGLIFLPLWGIFIFGMILMFGHNLLDGKENIALGLLSWLHVPSNVTINLFSPMTFIMDYNFIPWVGIPALGFVFGSVFLLNKKERTNRLLLMGLLCLLLFLGLRFFNVYGDPVAWSTQKDTLFSLMSFLNVNKYPPSLLYLLLTLGPAFFALIWFERCHNFLSHILSTFGKVPFFYYIAHVVLIHAIAIIMAYIRFGEVAKFFSNDILRFNPTFLAPYGYGLPVVYLVWIAVIVMLWPLCKWYANVKRIHKNNVLLSYL